jgi:hypothetical protein
MTGDEVKELQGDFTTLYEQVFIGVQGETDSAWWEASQLSDADRD